MPAPSQQIQLLHRRLPLLARATGLTLVVVFALLVIAAAPSVSKEVHSV